MRLANSIVDLETLALDDIGRRSKGLLGLEPCKTSKGLMPIDLLTEFLCASYWTNGIPIPSMLTYEASKQIFKQIMKTST